MPVIRRTLPALRVAVVAMLAALLLATVVHVVAPIRPVVALTRELASWVDAIDLAVEVRIRFVVGSG